MNIGPRGTVIAPMLIIAPVRIGPAVLLGPRSRLAPVREPLVAMWRVACTVRLA